MVGCLQSINSLNQSESVPLEKLLNELDFSKNLVIGVDGYDGSGKTTLTNKLGGVFPVDIISLDDYLYKERDCYVAALDLGRLQRTLVQRPRSIVMEGVCLLEVMSKLQVKCSFLIYIKRISEMGEWFDEEECTPMDDPEAFLVELGEQSRLFSGFVRDGEGRSYTADGGAVTGLRKEIILYHTKYDPVASADCVVLRTCS